ncbi:GAF and ANTAR domain-containing protein [Nocardioides dilutus]
MISTAQLSDLFVEIADTLVDDFDLVLFLQSLARHVAVVSDASAVGLMLADHEGELRFMAASDESVEMLELLQLQTREGPCLDCYVSGEPVVDADLSGAGDRWPVFAAASLEAGYVAVHAFPMKLRDSVIGSINAFSTQSGTLGDDEQRVIQGLADIATIAILQERAIARAEAVTEQLQSALNTRIVIEQAKGALARMQGVTVDEAFEIMRTRARSGRRRLVDIAGEVLTEGLSRPPAG